MSISPAHRRFTRALLLTPLCGSLALASLTALADDDDDDDRRRGACSATAQALFLACGGETRDDLWVALANCINQPDVQERRQCHTDAVAENRSANSLCADQLQARRRLCDQLGEDRYDPDFEPGNFVDPADIGVSVMPNPFFPLVPGYQWTYEATSEDEEGESVTEVIVVTVTDKTKLIEGVTCRVVNDLVSEDGEPIEDTDDWYAQDLEGNVWYCGEIARNFELFDGDDPEEAELVDVEGSWKAGRESAKPGILISANPQVGDVYRQEMALGDAEDAAEVVDLAGTADSPAASCAGNCLVTREFTPIEPGVHELKYYVPGIGKILITDMEGNREELVEFTMQ